MTEFVLALAAFLAAHVVPARPRLRARLIARAGRRGYLAGHSMVSLLLLAWAIDAARRAPYLPLWAAPPWAGWFAVLAAPAALALLGAGFAAPNPLSIALRSGPADAAPSGAAAICRHPILAGFALWGAAHVPVNGDLTSVILFAGAAVFACLGMTILDRRRHRELGEAWSRLAAATSLVPFVAILAGRARFPRDAATLAGALAGLLLALLLLTGGHRRLFGVDPLAAL